MGRFISHFTLAVGLLSTLSFSETVNGQGNSSNLSSSNLSSRSSSSSLSSGGGEGNLDWLDRRLSEKRSPLIRSRLGRQESGITSRDGSSSYLERRRNLNHRIGEDPFQTTEEGETATASELKRRESRMLESRETADEDESPLETARERPSVDLGDPAARYERIPRREGPSLESNLASHLEERLSRDLSDSRPMSDHLGYRPFETMNEEGKLVDERLIPFAIAKEEEETEAAAEEEEEMEEEDEATPSLILPSQRPILEEEEEEVLSPRMVRPAVPTPDPSRYELQSQNMWNQVPVRDTRRSQFGPAVNPSTVPFERSSVRNPGVYSGYQRPRVGGQTSSSYQYRGPRLYSIGESEYDSDTDYNSLPYYRR